MLVLASRLHCWHQFIYDQPCIFLKYDCNEMDLQSPGVLGVLVFHAAGTVPCTEEMFTMWVRPDLQHGPSAAMMVRHQAHRCQPLQREDWRSKGGAAKPGFCKAAVEEPPRLPFITPYHQIVFSSQIFSSIPDLYWWSLLLLWVLLLQMLNFIFITAFLCSLHESEYFISYLPPLQSLTSYVDAFSDGDLRLFCHPWLVDWACLPPLLGHVSHMYSGLVIKSRMKFPLVLFFS